VRDARLERLDREVLYQPCVELRWALSDREYVMTTYVRAPHAGQSVQFDVLYTALSDAMQSPTAIETLVPIARAHADEEDAKLRRLAAAAVLSLAALTWFLLR
jgi:hypothetical protein